jgi:protein-L-isoaspartate(D-aspartate) O-methyltransferase
MRKIRLSAFVSAALLAVTDRVAIHSAETASDFTVARRRMVEEQLVARGLTNTHVLAAMAKVPRHELVPAEHRSDAYGDFPLPIGHHQTISQPYIVAFMTEQLAPKLTDKVLEIGTGSGYQAAVLAGLVRTVHTIEIVEPLGRRADADLKRLGYTNVFVRIGDGYQGWPEAAPFDSIIVTCAPDKVPQPLIDQLKDGGRMIIPIGSSWSQELYIFSKTDGKIQKKAILPVRFVPMTGRKNSEPARPSK